MAVLCKNFFIVLLVSTTCPAQLTLDLNNGDPYPERENSVRLTCYGHTDVLLSENPSEGKIVWIKDGQVLGKWPVSLDSPSVQTQCPFTVSGTQYQDASSFFAYLDIASMDATCSGLYSCRLDRSEGNTLSTSIPKKLTMKQRPSSEYPTCSVHSVRGEQVLICTSERGAPRVRLQWWKDGLALQQTESADDFVQARWSATGDETSLGRFDCCLSFEGIQSGCCILDRPNVTIYSDRPTTNLEAGQDIIFTCIVSGNPAATVTWDKTHIQAPSQENDNELHVSNIPYQDNGSVVICKAQNAMGSNQASSMMTVRPPKLVVELVQTRTPESLGGLAQFNCRTIPPRSTHYIWQYNGIYIDPLNITDRFVMEKENILSVLQVSLVDIDSSVTCRIIASNQLSATVYLNASFSIPTDLEPEDFFGIALSKWLGYVISGLICLLLLGICCWVSLKAKSLWCNKKEIACEEKNETRGRFQNNRHELENLVVEIGNHPQPHTLPQVTKQHLAEQEATYQDLDDVARQINDYQRLISNDWAPQSLNSQLQS